MKYVYEVNDEVIIYNVYIIKNKLLEIKKDIIDENLVQKSQYNYLVNIIDGLVNDNSECLDGLLECDLEVSFLSSEINELQNKITYTISEISEVKLSEKERINLENHLYFDKEQLEIYKKLNRILKQQYYDYLLEVLSCIDLKKEETKKLTKKFE